MASTITSCRFTTGDLQSNDAIAPTICSNIRQHMPTGASNDIPGVNPPGTVTEICCPSGTLAAARMNVGPVNWRATHLHIKAFDFLWWTECSNPSLVGRTTLLLNLSHSAFIKPYSKSAARLFAARSVEHHRCTTSSQHELGHCDAHQWASLCRDEWRPNSSASGVWLLIAASISFYITPTKTYIPELALDVWPAGTG